MNALLAEEMAKWHEVTVLTSQGLGLPQKEVWNGVKIVRVPVVFRRQEAVANLLSMLMFLPMGALYGRALVRDGSFDVINTHFVLPTGPVGDALSRSGQVPNVLSLLGGDLYDPSKKMSPHRHAVLRAWIKLLVRRADVVVGSSTNTLGNLRRFYGVGQNAVRIPLGIRRPGAGVASRPDYGLRKSDVVFVTIGRLVARKAVDQLIRMMAAMRDDPACLLIIGTGPQEEELRAEVLRQSLDGRVRFLGHVDEAEKFRILRMSDVYLSTSQHEGFGLVFLEAMACGLPIVCYDHGGQSDFLEQGVTGYVLRLNDMDTFHDRCRSLARDSDTRERIGKENLQRVEELFIDRCASRYEAVFNDATCNLPNCA